MSHCTILMSEMTLVLRRPTGKLLRSAITEAILVLTPVDFSLTRYGTLISSYLGVICLRSAVKDTLYANEGTQVYLKSYIEVGIVYFA